MAEIRVREELESALRHAWAQIGQAGTWWNAEQRVAIASEVRAANVQWHPTGDDETHHTPTVALEAARALPQPAMEAIHEIRNNASRIGPSWYRRLVSAGLSEGQYVEIVSLVAIVTAIDTFCAGVGQEAWPLPTPTSGFPSYHWPPNAKQAVTWLSTLAPDQVSSSDPDLYRDRLGPRQRSGANIHLALSAVPQSMIDWWDLFEVMYLNSAQMREFAKEFRSISHAQIELLAARTSALNKCAY